MNAEMKVKQFTEEQLAYLQLGHHLLKTIERNHPDRFISNVKAQVIATLDKLLLSFCEADSDGSVCVNIASIDVSDEELTLLENIGLLVKAPLKLKDEPSKRIPFIWDCHGKTQRLYLQRRFIEEREVALSIMDFKAHASEAISAKQEQLIEDFKSTVYDNGKTADPKSLIEQETAIRGALSHAFFIITGGPGTGKTTVVAKLIECELTANPDLVIGLAAPTGKAASRVLQSINGSCKGKSGAMFVQLNEQLAQNKITSQTVHRWLSSETLAGGRPSEDNPLDVDILIVDEASMIDLTLAKQLLRCIDRKKTKLILLGDKFQLAAVGPGSVLADLTDPEVMADYVAELTISHRFTATSRIGRLANYINNQYFEESSFRDLFNHNKIDDNIFWPPYSSQKNLQDDTKEWIIDKLKEYLRDLKIYLESALRQPLLVRNDKAKAKALADVWKTADSFRILAAQRHGFNSVEAVNRFADEFVREEMNQWAQKAQEEGWLKSTDLQFPFTELFYPGRIIINRKNYAPLDIFNGDVGIVLPMSDDWSRYEVFFGDREEFRPAGLLPEHDTAYALTIHQSQGSQYDHVAVLLSNDPDSSLSTRELLYTGVTRAKKEVKLYANPQSVAKACSTKTQRASGLTQRLKEG